MTASDPTKEELPDISNLHLYTRTAPPALQSQQQRYNDLSSERLAHTDSGSSTNSSSSQASTPGLYHGLPNISADLQARVLAFQEKRQANSIHSQENGFNSKSDTRKKSVSSTSQKSPEKAPGTSSGKKIAPPMRLPPSLPQSNGPTSISSPLLSTSTPQAAARLPRSRPSLSQRRGMKLSVNDITNDDSDADNNTNNNNNNNNHNSSINNTRDGAIKSTSSSSSITTNNRGSIASTAKIITSSLSQQAHSDASSTRDSKKKPVAELLGNRRQLPAQQAAPQKLQGLFANYSKYVDIKSGSLNFNGKASLHSKGVDFSGGSSFRISIDELEFIDELGRGNYGTVSKVLHKPTNIIMAMKEVRLELDDSKFRQIIMELEILHNCNSDYIVDFYGAFFVEGAVYMCIEFMNLGSLDKIYESGLPEAQLAYIAKCVIRGLKQLKEEQNIIHRDVKPTNILINDLGKVKLCDFGVSGNLVASMARTNIGCQSYMAPERIKSANPDDVSYSVQSDVWSLGLSLLEVAHGEYPLTSENIFSQLKQIVEDDPPRLGDRFSILAQDFVSKCLAKEAKDRPTYAELLTHPWLLQYADDTKSENDLKEYLAHLKKM